MKKRIVLSTKGFCKGFFGFSEGDCFSGALGFCVFNIFRAVFSLNIVSHLMSACPNNIVGNIFNTNATVVNGIFSLIMSKVSRTLISSSIVPSSKVSKLKVYLASLASEVWLVLNFMSHLFDDSSWLVWRKPYLRWFQNVCGVFFEVFFLQPTKGLNIRRHFLWLSFGEVYKIVYG